MNIRERGFVLAREKRRARSGNTRVRRNNMIECVDAAARGGLHRRCRRQKNAVKRNARRESDPMDCIYSNGNKRLGLSTSANARLPMPGCDTSLRTVQTETKLLRQKSFR
ncbi:unnamed protein product, partial [Iphiclides podalirius]